MLVLCTCFLVARNGRYCVPSAASNSLLLLFHYFQLPSIPCRCCSFLRRVRFHARGVHVTVFTRRLYPAQCCLSAAVAKDCWHMFLVKDVVSLAFCQRPVLALVHHISSSISPLSRRSCFFDLRPPSQGPLSGVGGVHSPPLSFLRKVFLCPLCL
jgi:hypothetical protein